MQKTIIINTHSELLNVTPTTGIYTYLSDGVPIYIGKAVNLKARLLSHEQNAKHDAKEAQIVQTADHIELTYTPSEFTALLLEAKLIAAQKPKFNVRWRDDKSPLYIKITAHDVYPKVFLSRREADGSSLYFGPFGSVHAAETLLRSLRRSIHFCTQKRLTKAACFYHKIGLCDPCPNRIDRLPAGDEKSAQKRLYRSNIKKLIQVLSGESDKATSELTRSIKKSAREGDYEHALAQRDVLRRLEFLVQHGHIDDEINEFHDRAGRSLAELQALLTPFFPALNRLERLEGYDNSTLGFEHSVASMVVFEQGRANLQEYRRFKLDPETSISDFDMMREVMERRMRNKQWQKPDLIVIDGGKPQLAVIERVFVKLGITIPCIGIAKHPDRLIALTPERPTMRPAQTDYGFRLIQSIRDEAHRFAKKYHVHLRDKQFMVQ